MSELEHLTSIISTILAKDNEARNKSEMLLRQLQLKDINQYVLVFVNLLSVSPRKDIRIFCALHLRRLLSNYADKDAKSDWVNLTGETQKVVKSLLVESLNKESVSSCQKILCDLIGELVATIKTLTKEEKDECAEEGRQWEEINEYIFAFLSSENPVLVGNGLKILGVLFRYCNMDYIQHKEQILQILNQALQQNDLKIKTRAIECLSEYVENVEFKDCKIFVNLVPLLLKTVVDIIDKNEDLGVEVMANLTDMIEIEPKMFRTHFRDVFDTLKFLGQNKKIDTPALRENALETMVILIQKSPKLAGKQEGIAKDAYEAIFSYMVICADEIDDEWLRPSEELVGNRYENESHEFSIKYCMDLFNRIIACLGQELTLVPLATMLQQMVEVNEWRYKYSALMALSQVGEFVTETPELDPLVDFNLNFLRDEHPKVRYAALHCIGQLADDKRYDFQLRYSKIIIPALIESFNEQVARVTSHALAALTNFLEGASKRCVEEWISRILEPCLNFLNEGALLVKENAIATIAALAVSSRQDFIPYWEKTAEIIFSIIKDGNDKNLKQLRAQAIECLTLIGDAVGKQQFSKAAPEIIRTLITIQQNNIEDVDPQKTYLLAGWQRLSNLFKQEFSPYLKEILPSLFMFIDKIIRNYEKSKNSRETDDAYDTENVLGENDEKSLFHGANTYESEEVSLVVKMISTFLTESWEGCLPYVEKTSEILVYLLAKSKNDQVRVTAAKALPEVIRVLKASDSPGKDAVVTLTSNLYLNLLWTAYLDEIELGSLMTFISSMKGIIENAGRHLEEKQIEALTDNIMNSLRESDSRKQSNQEMLQEEENEIDEDQLNAMEEENEKEDELHCVLAELIGALFATHQELTLGIAHLVLKQLVPNALQENSTFKIQKFGLILVNAMVEYLGIALMPNEMPFLFQIIIKFAPHKHPEVRDTAHYGIGILAERFGEHFQAIAEPCGTAVLESLAIKPRKEEDKRLFWRTRARVVISLGKLIKFQSQYYDVRKFIQVWLVNLPIAYFIEDAKLQHEMLLDIILELDPTLIFGENGQFMGVVLKIFADLINTRLIFDTFPEKMKKVLRSLEENEKTQPLLKQAIESLTLEAKEKLAKAMSQ